MAIVTASCEHCSEEGAPVACIVGAYGLCAECKARMDAYGILEPVTEPEPSTNVDWDAMQLKLDAMIKALQSNGRT